MYKTTGVTFPYALCQEYINILHVVWHGKYMLNETMLDGVASALLSGAYQMCVCVWVCTCFCALYVHVHIERVSINRRFAFMPYINLNYFFQEFCTNLCCINRFFPSVAFFFCDSNSHIYGNDLRLFFFWK